MSGFSGSIRVTVERPDTVRMICLGPAVEGVTYSLKDAPTGAAIETHDGKVYLVLEPAPTTVEEPKNE